MDRMDYLYSVPPRHGPSNRLTRRPPPAVRHGSPLPGVVPCPVGVKYMILLMWDSWGGLTTCPGVDADRGQGRQDALARLFVAAPYEFSGNERDTLRRESVCVLSLGDGFRAWCAQKRDPGKPDVDF